MMISNSNLKRAELVLLLSGLLLIGVAGFLYVGGGIYGRKAAAGFQSESSHMPPHAQTGSRNVTRVDYSLWSPKRIEQYEAALTGYFEKPLAILRIDKVRLVAPVFEGTSDLKLNLGLGHIAGTAKIGETGNIGIAGHRDGFFRGLKDVVIGDRIQLETSASAQIYMIDSIRRVEPNDVSVLRNDAEPSLTLVTCYPFYFVGNAPQRYVVHAILQRETRTTNESAKASSQATASRSKEKTP